MRAPRECLRFQTGASTTGVKKPCCNHTFWILPGPFQYTETSKPTSSRLPTIHLSKSFVNTAANQSRLVVVIPFFRPFGPVRGRRMIPSGPPLSIGCRENLLAIFATSKSTAKQSRYPFRGQHLAQNQLAMVALRCTTDDASGFARQRAFQGVATATSGLRLLPAAVQAPQQT